MTRRANSEGSYYRRPDGRWKYRVVVNGRRISANGRTRREAKDAAVAKSRTAAPVASGDTWSDVFRDWSGEPSANHGLRPATRDQYAAMLRAHAMPKLGDKRPETLTRKQVADTLRTIHGASAKRALYAAWVKLSDYAISRGALGVNVVRQVPRPPTPQHPRREATPEQMTTLLAAASGHRWELTAWLVVLAGLRRGEILGLRWQDVDLDGRSLHIAGSLARTTDGLARGEPKTARGKRRVPIPTALLQAFIEHRKRQNAERLAAVYWRQTGYVVTSEIGTPVEPRNMSRAWSLWAKGAGLTDRGMHLGRHYAATQMLGSGRASVADVAAQLGHDPSMLLSTYAVALADGQRAAADYLADTIGVGPTKR